MFYDSKFGRKRESEPKDTAANGHAVSNGDHSNGAANGSTSVKNTSDMAIYEQFRNQVFCLRFKWMHFAVFLVLDVIFLHDGVDSEWRELCPI